MRNSQNIVSSDELRIDLWVVVGEVLSPYVTDADACLIGADTVEQNSRTSIRLGEDLRIYYRASLDCYISLLLLGSSGCLTVMLPNKHVPDHRAVGGQVYSLPRPAMGISCFKQQGPVGIDRLKAIASLQETPVLIWDLSDDAVKGLVTAETTLELKVEH